MKVTCTFMSRRPSIDLHGDGAIAKTNVVIIGDNAELGLNFTCYARFCDEVGRRDCTWRLWRRQVIYGMSHFNLLDSSLTIDQGKVGRRLRAYAALAYVLKASGLTLFASSSRLPRRSATGSCKPTKLTGGVSLDGASVTVGNGLSALAFGFMTFLEQIPFIPARTRTR